MNESAGRRPYSILTLGFLALVSAFLAAFLVYPILYVVREAFWIDGRISLVYFRHILENPVTREAVLNSVLLGLATTVVTTVLSVPLAFVAARYRFAGKGLLMALLLVPMIMPPFVGAIGIMRLLAQGGSINLLLMKIGITHAPIDFLNASLANPAVIGFLEKFHLTALSGLCTPAFWGVVALEVLHLYPIMYLNVAAALANVDPSLEEAARNMGDSGFRLFRKVTFPLMLPGYFAGAVLVFIWAFTDLGTPLILGYSRVAAVEIFNKISDINTNPAGYALVVVVIGMTAAAFLAGKFYIGRHGYEMLSKGTTARHERAASRPATAAIWAGLLLLVMVALLPHVSVFLTSITGTWSDTVLPTEVTGRYYTGAFQEQLARTGVRNSVLLSLVSTGVDVLLGVGIAYILVRRRFWGADLLDVLSMLPLALPGLVLAFGYVACFSGTPLDPRGNPFPLLIIAYSIRRLPYMVRAAYAGFQQTSVVLEEAAQNVGASPRQALFRITLPLILANLIAGAILTFSFAMLEVSDSLILAWNAQHYPLTKAIYVMHQYLAEGDFIASAMGILAMLLLAGTLIVAGLALGKKMGQLFRV